MTLSKVAVAGVDALWLVTARPTEMFAFIVTDTEVAVAVEVRDGRERAIHHDGAANLRRPRERAVAAAAHEVERHVAGVERGDRIELAVLVEIAAASTPPFAADTIDAPNVPSPFPSETAAGRGNVAPDEADARSTMPSLLKSPVTTRPARDVIRRMLTLGELAAAVAA